jgi:hypothetical protein
VRKARKAIEVFSLSFLDAITCGFGAVILVYMIINAGADRRADRATAERRAEVDRLEQVSLEGYKGLVELRNAVRETDDAIRSARGLSARLVEEVSSIREELASQDASGLARRGQLARLSAELRSLEQEFEERARSRPREEPSGDHVRAFVGDGDRQYLTGLKLGGQRILILIDSSASMLGDTIVNVIRRRNLPDDVKIRADKWQQAVRTVDWLTTQLPRSSRFQLYAFDERSRPVVEASAGQWLDAGSAADLERAVDALRSIVPAGGTSLHAAFHAAASLRPAPDNLILLTDGLPTLGEGAADRRTVTGKQRAKHFDQAIRLLPARVPVNVILFPMEGDPLAASAFWKLAVATGGSYLSPAADWP